MRHAKPDSFKKANGTLQSRWTEEARAKRAIDNVLTFPQLKEIPDPSVLLVQGGAGEKAYFDWCERLLRNNLLTAVSVGFVETFALGEDKICSRLTAGREVPDKTLEIRRSMLMRFESLNVDGAIVPDQRKPNKFAKTGFPALMGKLQHYTGSRGGLPRNHDG